MDKTAWIKVPPKQGEANTKNKRIQDVPPVQTTLAWVMHTNQKFAASQMKKGNDKKSPNKDLINPNKEDKRLALSKQLVALTEDSNDEIHG